MTHFTDSPYERMMQQVPTKEREATGPPAFFTGNSCCACPYGRGAPCVGICYQKLLKGSGSHAVSDR